MSRPTPPIHRRQLLQAGSLVLYVVAAHGFGGENLIIAASTAEHLLGGIATVALFTLMMDACDKAHASTDYTLLACAVVVAHGTANFCGAALADAFGYAPMFSLGLLLAVAGTLTLVRQLDQGRGPQPLGKVWKVSSTS